MRLQLNWLIQSLVPEGVLDDWVLQPGMPRSRDRKGIGTWVGEESHLLLGCYRYKKERN